MTFLLEIREKLRNLYGKYEIYVVVAVKFILGIAVFSWINNELGYMERLNQLAVVLLLALVCAFLPIGAMVAAAGGLVLLHRPLNASALRHARAAGDARGYGAFGGAVLLPVRPQRGGSLFLYQGHPGEYRSIYGRR